MTTLSLLFWILLAFALQLGVLFGVSFWRHWQTYTQLKAAQGAGVVGALAPNTAQRTQPPQPQGAGWPGWRTFKVTHRKLEDAAGLICSFTLAPVDGKLLPTYRPGQYLSLRFAVPQADGRGEEQIIRCYSLSAAPQPNAATYRISVKRIAASADNVHPPGRVSNYLHEHLAVGATLEARAPSGHFYLDDDSTPIVLIAGGIGITPLLAMLDWCQQQEAREIWFYYAVRNPREAAFLPHLQAVAKAHAQVRLRLCFSEPLPDALVGDPPTGRISLERLRLDLPLKPFHFYICGPTSLMHSLVSGLQDWGVPPARIHYEAFGPASIHAAPPALETNGQALNVTFGKSGKTLEWSGQAASLLELAEGAGINLPSGCRAGGCGSCQTALLAGEVRYLQTPEFDPEPGACLPCVCAPKTPITLDA